MHLRFGFLALLGILPSSAITYGQSEACHANDFLQRVPVQETKISITGLEFQGEDPLSDVLRAQLVKDIQQNDRWVTAEQPDSSWVVEALEPMRDALRKQGYFKADVEGTPYLVLAQSNERRYVLSVAIESGPQYRLGKLRFASATETPLVFSESLLRKQIPLQEGQLFDVSKIREGLEAIGRLYGSKGYIDATPEPDTTVDGESSTIDLLIKVDEQRPYIIREIEIVGLDAKTRKELQTPQEDGDRFVPPLWREFFDGCKAHLPADASLNKNMQVRRDIANGTVDIILDFRLCPNNKSRVGF
jgi:hypothetical protein